MLAWKLAVLVCAATGGNETALLCFHSHSCPPCRMMEPVVASLEQQGYPIRHVNLDQQPELAAKYGVTGIPAFIMLSAGRETGRTVGVTSASALVAMIEQGKASLPRRPAPNALEHAWGPVAPDSAGPIAAPARRKQLATPRSPIDEELLQATVRIVVDDGSGRSFGSGTVVHRHANDALIVTCGHIFRDSQGQGAVQITMFTAMGEKDVPGELLAFDLEDDVAIVAIRDAGQTRPVPIAPTRRGIVLGANVVSVGCDQGSPPTARHSSITAIDKYLGPANIEAAGEPVLGRSGGGLFNTQGQLIGVCNAADPQDQEGLYAALTLVHRELDDLGLSFAYQEAGSVPSSTTEAHGNESPRGLTSLVSSPNQGGPDRMPGETQSGMQDRAASSAEVICVVRPQDGSGPDRVVVINQASQRLLDLLQAEQQRHSEQPALTSMRVEDQSASMKVHAAPAYQSNRWRQSNR